MKISIIYKLKNNYISLQNTIGDLIMNIANKVTMVRVFLVPIFIFSYYYNINNQQTLTAIIFIIASLTDALDGYLARSKNLVTNFGKFIDPLADKILTATALILLVEAGKVAGWIVVIIIAREFTITGFRILAAAEGITIAASPLGKIKTISQLFAIILLLLDNTVFINFNIPMDYLMLYVSLIFTVLSGIDYIYKNLSVLNLEDK